MNSSRPCCCIVYWKWNVLIFPDNIVRLRGYVNFALLSTFNSNSSWYIIIQCTCSYTHLCISVQKNAYIPLDISQTASHAANSPTASCSCARYFVYDPISWGWFLYPTCLQSVVLGVVSLAFLWMLLLFSPDPDEWNPFSPSWTESWSGLCCSNSTVWSRGYSMALLMTILHPNLQSIWFHFLLGCWYIVYLLVSYNNPQCDFNMATSSALVPDN